MLEPFDERFKNLSVFKAEYMNNTFLVPQYPWEALTPFWEQIAMAITKVLVYHKFSSDCFKDAKMWKANRAGKEALVFADLLSRDLGMRRAVVDFNKQAVMLKYGGWIEPFYQDTPQYFNQLSQFGQLIWNSMNFLIRNEYLEVHKVGLGVEVIRPYWAPITELSLRRLWMVETFRWMKRCEENFRRTPNLEEISSQWKIPRYTLIEAGFTRETLMLSYRYWKETGNIKFVEPKKEFKLITEKEQEEIAKNIMKRIKT